MIARFALLIALGLNLAAHPPAALATTAAGELQQDATAKVWVHTRSSVYYCPGPRDWSNTKAGILMAEDDYACMRTGAHAPI